MDRRGFMGLGAAALAGGMLGADIPKRMDLDPKAYRRWCLFVDLLKDFHSNRCPKHPDPTSKTDVWLNEYFESVHDERFKYTGLKFRDFLNGNDQHALGMKYHLLPETGLCWKPCDAGLMFGFCDTIFFCYHPGLDYETC